MAKKSVPGCVAKMISEARALSTTFAEVGPLWMRWCHARMKKTGFSFARFKLLATLDVFGAQIMSDLSEHLGVTPRNITALVDALEGEGLVKRSPHPTDRRATIISMTPAGNTASCAPRKEFEEESIALFAQLTESEQRLLRKLLGKFKTVLVRELAESTDLPAEPTPPRLIAR